MKIKTPSLRILNEYKKEILNKAVSNGWNNGVLKVIISRGVGGRGYKFEKVFLLQLFSYVFIVKNQILAKIL